jgi:hypothetical protein
MSCSRLGREAHVDALTLLKHDHDNMKKLLARVDETTERARKTRRDLLRRITREMVVHEKIEERIFYPALKQHPKGKDLVLEGYQEHHVVDVLLGELDRTDVTDERWGAKMTVLKENIAHHIEDEEGEMFKAARAVFARDELEALGARMEEMKDAEMAVR